MSDALISAEEVVASARALEQGVRWDDASSVRDIEAMYTRALGMLQECSITEVGVSDLLRTTHANRALVRLRLGENRGAEEDGRAAKALEALASAAPASRAEAACARQRGDEAYAARDWARANDEYTAALELVPDQPDLLAQRGMVRLMLGDTEGAAKDDAAANQAMDEQRPEQIAAVTSRARQEREAGSLFFKQGHVPQALQSYSRALALVPNDDAVLANRSLCHLKLGDADAALEDALAAIKVAPNNAKAHYRRAKACQSLGKLDDALTAMEEVCRLLPNAKDMRADRDALAKQLNVA